MDKKRRILIISSHKNVGGAAKIADNIHLCLRENGYEVKTLYGRGDKSEDLNFVKIESDLEVYYSALMTRLTGKVGYFNRRATKKAIDYIENWNPDVIHLHNVHGYYINIPMLLDYIRRKEIPVVWTMHDCFPFTGKCGYHFECEKWREGCGGCEMLKNYPKVYRDRTDILWNMKKEKITSINKMMIVTPSEWLSSEVRDSFLGKYPCKTINNGIDTSVFYPRDKAECRKKYGFSEQEKIVLGIAVGYSDPRKGAKYIIALAKYLEEKAKVVLVGWDNSNKYMLEGVNNAVTVSKIDNQSALAEYYSLADVFVIPSLAENYATTTIEAMACGIPAVGFKSGGIPEQITEGRGICVEAGNQNSFNEAVSKILNKQIDYLERDDLFSVIREENSIDVMVGKYKDTINELMTE